MHSLRREIRATASLALPMIVTQIGQMAMFTTDVVMVGRLGAEALAAVGLGSALFVAALLFALGVVLATGGLAAQAFGADDRRALSEVTGQGLVVAVLVSIPVIAVALLGERILLLLGQEPRLAALAGEYLAPLIWGAPAMLGFVALRSFFGAFNRPWPPFFVTLLTVPLNGFVDWLLIFGKFGFPALGVAGAGYATSFSALFSFFLLLGFALVQEPYRGYGVLARLWPFLPRRIWEIFRLGLPIGATLLMETGLFGSAAMMMGWLGASQLAAHQIALQIISILFMVPVGIGQAATVRVGNEIGRGDMGAARHAGYTAIGLGLAFMACSATLIWTVPETLAGLFIDRGDADAAAVVSMAATFLAVAAVFQFVDGTQVIGAHALRGLNDTRLPMYFAVIGYWALGFTSSYILGFKVGLGGEGIWYGFLVGLGATAFLITVRFAWLTRQGAPAPAVAAPSTAG